jgi:HEAT repeat protein
VILLWLGRADIATEAKEAFMAALIGFEDGCGGFYSYRAYFLAAAGLGEFPQSTHAEGILTQLLQWRFGEVSPPLREGARVALLQTDRPLAIATLEQCIQTTDNPFTAWQAAYTLGKILDPGNAMAIATLIHLIDTVYTEALRLQVIESLGKMAPDHPIVLRSIQEILASTQQDKIRCRAAYSLGKMNPGNAHAIAVLEQLIDSTLDATVRLVAAKNLILLDTENRIAVKALDSLQKKSVKTSQKRQIKPAAHPTSAQLIARLEQRLATAKNTTEVRRIAFRLGTLQPGHPQAIACLLQLLLSTESSTSYKRLVEDLKQVLLDHQFAEAVVHLKEYVARSELSVPTQPSSVQWHECHKLLWYCAQQMSYAEFSKAWIS